MKKLLLRIHCASASILLGTLLAIPLAAQPATLAPGEIVWARGSSGELDSLRTRYGNMVRREGNAKSDDARDLQRAIEATESRLPSVLSFNFPGGPLSKFLALISKANVVSFNIIAAGDQADLEAMLPPFTLRNAPLGTIFDVLHNLLLPRGLTLTSSSGGNDQQMVCVLARHAPTESKSDQPPVQFESFSLNNQLADQSIDDIVGAIRAGWELDPAHDREALRLKFHPATSILLVSGPPDAITVAAKVISQLTISSDKGFRPNKRPPQTPSEQKR